MPPRAFLAFDLGAQSGRAVVGTLGEGRLTIREIHRFPNRLREIHGRLHWDLFRLLDNLHEGLAACADLLETPPVSFGIDTWGVDFGLLARDGTLLGLPVAYRDARTAGAMEWLAARVSRETIYDRTGIQFLPFNTLFQLAAMVRDESPLLGAAADLLFVPDLFHYLLTGVKRTEFSFATTSQLFNPRTHAWDDDLLAALGLPRSLLQDVVLPGTRLGALTPAIGAATGLGELPLVAVATHDTGSAVAAVPATGDDWAYLSSGTWSLLGVETREPILTAAARDANFTNEGGVDGTFRVLKNITGLWLLQQCRQAWDADLDYGQLIAAAQSAPAFAALVDPDDAAFLNPPDMPAAIADFCRRTDQPPPEGVGAVTRCILESLALKYAHVLDQARALTGKTLRRLHVIGGGGRNALLCRLTADAARVEVHAGPIEATAIGNLLVQAMAAGDIADLATLRATVGRSFEPTVYAPRDPAAWDSPRARFAQLLTHGK